MCYVLQGYVNIHEKVKVPVHDAQAGRVGSLPPSPPCSVGGAVGGGRGEEVGEPCPAWDLERGRGISGK